MSISTNYFHNFLTRKFNLHRFSNSPFKERRCCISSLSPLSTLPKRIITHRKYFSLLIQSNKMVRTTGYHSYILQVLNQNRLIQIHFSLYLVFVFTKMVIVLWHMFSNFKDITCALFSQYKHSSPCKLNLLYFFFD